MLAAACALAAGLLILRSQAAPEDRVDAGRGSAAAGAAIALVGALVMLVGLIVPVDRLDRILTSKSYQWWLGLQIILAAGVVIVVAARVLGDGRMASLPATAH